MLKLNFLNKNNCNEALNLKEMQKIKGRDSKPIKSDQSDNIENPSDTGDDPIWI